tara:strand:+ start:3898 stop:4764 length:867 start_codon:yes stop_codon:yes gene_type:complete
MNSIQLDKIFENFRKDFKIFLLILISIGCILILLNFLLNNKYKSESIWIYVTEQDSNQFNGIPDEYLGLGSMFGIDTQTTDNFEVYVAKLSSKDFLKNMFEDHFFMVNVLNQSPNLFDDNQISENGYMKMIGDEWIINGNIDYDAIHDYVFSDVVNIDYDNFTKFLYVSARHKNNQFSQEIISKLFDTANDLFRAEQISKSNLKISFLRNYSKDNLNINIDNSISSIVQVELQKIMTASTAKNYKFDYIDSPNKPLLKDYPGLLVQIILWALSAIAIYIVYVFVRYID